MGRQISGGFRSDLRTPVHLETLCIRKSFNETVCTICVQCTGLGMCKCMCIGHVYILDNFQGGTVVG